MRCEQIIWDWLTGDFVYPVRPIGEASESGRNVIKFACDLVKIDINYLGCYVLTHGCEISQRVVGWRVVASQ